MLVIEMLFLFIFVAFVQGTTLSQFANWLTSWIEAGSIAAPGEFPYQVSLRDSKSTYHFCGGSIVNRDYIVTAAHCVFGDTPDSLVAVVGTNKLSSGGQRHDLSRIIIHPAYNNITGVNDIALLKVKQEMGYSPTVQNILLPLEDAVTKVGTTCVTSGWGLSSPSGTTLPNDLQKLQVNIIPSTKCKKLWIFPDNKICAYAAPKKGLCQGDSGGPLVCDRQLVGVFKGGGTWTSNCTSNYPIDFAYVSKYIRWIKKVAV